MARTPEPDANRHPGYEARQPLRSGEEALEMPVVSNLNRAVPAPFERLPRRVIPRYTLGMKTAISLPDEIFESADALAERLGLSRSELYATAVAEYLAKHRDEDVTSRLNDVFADEPSGVDPAIRSAQARSVGSAEW